MTTILHIIQALTLGGAARSLIAKARYSAESGAYRHSILTLHSCEPAAAQLARENGIQAIANAPERTERDRLIAAADIVEVHWWNTPEMQAFLHEDLPPMRMAIWYHVAGDAAPHIISPELMNLADYNIACNNYTLHHAPGFAALSPERKQACARMYIDGADFRRVEGIEPQPHSGFNVGYIGTVDFFKMHPDYVSMSAAVKVPGVKFIVCGGGKTAVLQQQAARLNAADRFDLRGYVEDIRSVIAILDVYGYPLCERTYAAAELNLQEVMVARVPPVVFPYGGIPSLVNNGETGIIVNTAREYAEAIEYLYNKPAERRRLGENARQWALEHFGAHNAAKGFNKLYAEMLQQPKHRRDWRTDFRLSPLEAGLSYRQISGEAERFDLTEMFVESLGAGGGDFAESMAGQDNVELYLADRRIAASDPLVFDTGIMAYRNYEESAGYLRLWTGLVCEEQGNYQAAVQEYTAAIQYGCTHWRVLWYLARALEKAGNTKDSGNIMQRLRAGIPGFDALTASLVEAAAKEAAKSLPAAPPEQAAPRTAPPEQPLADKDESEKFLLSVVVSTYASERFIRGCLEELVHQNIYTAGYMEIIVIDAHSPENEAAIVGEFQERHANIRYIRTDEREGLYDSWNRACALARGRYIGNANTDDRRRADCFEKLVLALEQTGAGIAYSDLAYGHSENTTYDKAVSGVWQFPDFDPRLALHYCMGCFTIVWRKSAWQALGGFDAARYQLAADFDFFTRAALTFGAEHVPEPLTMALLHEGQQSRREEQMNAESDKVRAAFTELPLDFIFPAVKGAAAAERSRAYTELGNAAITLREPWYGPRQVAVKPRSALVWYQKALAENPHNTAALYNLALLSTVVGRADTARQLLEQYRHNSAGDTGPALARAREFITAFGNGGSHDLLGGIPLMPSGFDAGQAAFDWAAELAALDAEEHAAEPAEPQDRPAAGRPRILFTMYGWLESGGGSMFPRSVALRLAELGYEIAVFYAAGEHPKRSEAYTLEKSSEEGVHLYGVFNRPTVFLDAAMPERETEDPAILRHFAGVLDSFRPHVVHFHNFLGLSFAIAAEVRRRGIASFYTPHNYHLIDPALYLIRADLKRWNSVDITRESDIARKLPQKAEQFAARQVRARALLQGEIDYILCVSDRQRELLAQFAGGASGRLAVVHQAPASLEVLEQAGITPHPPHKPLRFGYIGGVIPHKGVHKIVEAAQLLPRGCAEIRLYGYAPEEYRRLLERIDKAGAVRWMKEFHAGDLPHIAAEVDCMIVPSIWEECAGLVIVESLAMGLPVIGAHIGGISDFVREGYNGRLYNPDSHERLAAVMRGFVERPERLRELQAGTGLAYGFNDYVVHVADLYTRAAAGETLSMQAVERRIVTGSARAAAPAPTAAEAVAQAETPALNRLQFDRNLQGGFSNRPAAGALPDPLPRPLLLNLGCGRDIREGFLNIDLFSDDPRVVGMDVRRLDLPDACADGVLASDILEHFSHREVGAVLREWARVLKPGGELVIRCPSLHLQVQAYMRGVWDADVASYMIFGGQTNPGDYHCIGFDEQSIRRHLAAAGLQTASVEEQDVPQDKGYINLNMLVRAYKAPVEQAAPVTEAPVVPAETAAGGEPPNIVWEGSQFVHHSLALINREHCSNIIGAGLCELTIVPYEADGFAPEGNPKYETLKAHDVRYRAPIAEARRARPCVWIRHQWPPKTEPPKGARWIINQPWEFSTLRKDFVELFNRADEIWTPSTFCRAAFVRSGVEFDKVQIVPNGIDPQLFTPYGEKFELPTGKRLRFLFVGGTIFRKGIDVLLDAWRRAFTAQDDVCLVIKDMGGDSFYKGQTARDAIAQIRAATDAPEIVYLDEQLSEQSMAALYRACDVFVSPYRGEGFLLPALEAMACGLPVIVTAGGATDDFVDEHTGLLISADERGIGSVIDGHPLSGPATVLEPHVGELVAIIQNLAANPERYTRLGIAGMLRARTQWTWKRATLKAFARLDALCGSSLAVDAQDGLHDPEDAAIHFARAEAANAAGQVDTAIELYRRAIDERGLPYRYTLLTLHRLAAYALQAGEVELAEEYLAKAATLDADHPDSRYLRALCQAWRQDWEAVLDTLDNLIQQWDSLKYDVMLGFGLDTLLADAGRGLFELDFVDDAREFYQKALELNADNADACYGAGLCFFELGAPEEARTMFEWALRLRPDFSAAEAALQALSGTDNPAE